MLARNGLMAGPGPLCLAATLLTLASSIARMALGRTSLGANASGLLAGFGMSSLVLGRIIGGVGAAARTGMGTWSCEAPCWLLAGMVGLVGCAPSSRVGCRYSITCPMEYLLE